MRIHRIILIVTLALALIVPTTLVVGADQPQVSLSPDRIVKGTAATITITLDKNIPDQKEIRKVRIAGQVIAVQEPSADGKLSVVLPELNIIGRADIEVLGKDDKPVAVGQLEYVDAAEPPIGSSTGLVIIYVLLIVLLPVASTIYDIKKSYAERTKVLDKLKQGSTVDEIKGLLTDMDQGPTGLIGLTRGVIAVTLVLILAIAAFHFVVFGNKVPDIAEKLLTLLAGTLTAITGFYFGARTAESAKSQAPSAPLPAVGGTPAISDISPKPSLPGAEVTLTGAGFGDDQGNVFFEDVEATVKSKSWSDKSIIVTVPTGLSTKKPRVTVKSKSGGKSNPYLFEVT
jgi:hypothetical protein